MRASSNRASATWCAASLVALGAWACSGGDDGGGDPNGMAGSAATAGSSSAAGSGTIAGAAAGGSPQSGGSSTAGGPAAGAGTGGAATGGAPTGGSPAGGAGGKAPMGGAAPGGAGGMSMAGAGSGGMSMGGSGPGTCTKGQTKGKDVAVIGESFIAATHGITKEIEKQATAAGSLPAGEHYIDNSVSGTTLANNQIPSQYTKAAMNGAVKYVLMDGGGNDCLLNNNGDAAFTAAQALFKTMAEKGTEKVLYFFYPDPVGANYSSLKSCLDALRPKMKTLCDGLTAPKCYWLDLRPTWNGHNEYTSDGIHPTDAGSVATGDVVWEAMKASCVAQ